jgi:hypothetical protein
MERSLPASQATAACARVSLGFFTLCDHVVILTGALQMNSHPCGLAHGLRVQVAGPHAKASVCRNMEWELERRALLKADNG